MKGFSGVFVALAAFPGILAAQAHVTRHTLEFDSVGLFPIGGYKADAYSAGPGLRGGYEFRLQRYVTADVGWTAAWAPGTACDRFGCTHPRYQNRLLDYGLRGVLPLGRGRVEVSAGFGGGYIWFSPSSDSYYYNGSLLQYSAKGTVALNGSRRARLGLTVRAWRDTGRPTQQWLTTAVGVSYGFGGLR